MSLGISALLLYVPVSIAAIHQAGSLTLFTLCLWFRHTLAQDIVPAVKTKPSVATAAAAATVVGGTAATRAFTTSTKQSFYSLRSFSTTPSAYPRQAERILPTFENLSSAHVARISNLKRSA